MQAAWGAAGVRVSLDRLQCLVRVTLQNYYPAPSTMLDGCNLHVAPPPLRPAALHRAKPAHARGYQSLPPTIKVWKRPDEDSFTYTQNDDGEITTLGQKTPLPKLSVGESRVKAMCDAYNKASVMNGSVSCCFLYLY